jgi:biopolymer transport protein ExbD
MGIRRRTGGTDRVEQQMTPMIDVVFQLLAFFTLTLKIVAPEGDFNVKMPLVAPNAPPAPPAFPPIHVRLHADAAGRLADIELGGRSLDDLDQLRKEIRQIVGDNPGPGVVESAEVEIDCDYQLHFRHVTDAITAVSGYIADDGQTIVSLVERIKFSPPHAQD